MHRLLKAFASVGFLLVAAVPLSAQNNRSAVSVTGSDTATCTVPDPCRTFAIALSKTNSGGEVVALSSGGYGPFTIDRPATVAAAPGVYAAIALNGLGACITVDSGAGARVVIRGLSLYGFGFAQFGIDITHSGEETHIENCTIDGIGNGDGVVAFLNVTVTDTVIRGCRSGIWINAPVKGNVERVQIYDTTALYGLLSAGGANVTARDTISIRSAGSGFHAEGGKLTLENCLSTRATGYGIAGIGMGGVARISNCVVTDNTYGLVGTIETFGNNKIRGNGTNVSATLTSVAQQ
jgi:hypothetical protein